MIVLKRTYKKRWTEGVMTMPDGSEIFTLERPWKDNQVNISCIPEGEYIIERNTTGKHQYYGVKDVEGRTFIELHPANIVQALQGCIAPCMSLHDGVAQRSIEACVRLLNWFGDDSWVLKITS